MESDGTSVEGRNKVREKWERRERTEEEEEE